jgi:hypothetical protein
MVKQLFFLLPLLLWACSQKPSTPDEPATEKTQALATKGKQSLEQFADREVRAKLNIQANEQFELKIYKSQLDADGIEDAIVSVNRKQFAMQEAMAAENPAKRAEVGFMGNYNYIFFFDGKLDMLSPPIAIPSSPLLPLSIQFEHISSMDYFDILIDFRIRNASYRDFFTVANHTPRRIFQFKNFDGLGTPQPEAYSFTYGAGSYGPQRNIFVMDATLEPLPAGADKNTYIPKVSAKNTIKYSFFYLEKEGKYATRQQAQ